MIISITRCILTRNLRGMWRLCYLWPILKLTPLTSDPCDLIYSWRHLPLTRVTYCAVDKLDVTYLWPCDLLCSWRHLLVVAFPVQGPCTNSNNYCCNYYKHSKHHNGSHQTRCGSAWKMNCDEMQNICSKWQCLRTIGPSSLKMTKANENTKYIPN